MPEVRLDDAALASAGIEQTLTRLRSATAIRLQDGWAPSARVGLLSGALLGSLRNRPLQVHLSGGEALVGAFGSGVATALSGRPRHLDSFDESATRLRDAALWQTWTTGTKATTEALFAEVGTADDEPATVGPTYATFVNPHLSSSARGHADVVFLVRRWLVRRLRAQVAAADAGAVDLNPTRKVAEALHELVANVQEHASGSGGRVVDCLVRVQLDDRTVRCSVVDNGQGITASLRGKPIGAGDPAQVLTDLLTGQTPPWHGGRGVGLPRVADLARDHGGHVYVASGDVRASVDSEGRVTAGTGGIDLNGVVVEFDVPVG